MNIHISEAVRIWFFAGVVSLGASSAWSLISHSARGCSIEGLGVQIVCPDEEKQVECVRSPAKESTWVCTCSPEVVFRPKNDRVTDIYKGR